MSGSSRVCPGRTGYIGPGREARVARGRGSRVADFARGRGSRGAGRRPPATLPTLVLAAAPRALRSGIRADPEARFYPGSVLIQSGLNDRGQSCSIRIRGGFGSGNLDSGGAGLPFARVKKCSPNHPEFGPNFQIQVGPNSGQRL